MSRRTRAWLLAGCAAASLHCGRAAKDPKAEGHLMPIEITEERPVDAPGTSTAELPPQAPQEPAPSGRP